MQQIDDGRQRQPPPRLPFAEHYLPPSRESVHFAYPRPSWQQPCYRNPLLPLPSPPCLSVCPLKTLLIAFWPHWPRRWRRWSWRRQHRPWGRAERSAGSVVHATCRLPLATGNSYGSSSSGIGIGNGFQKCHLPSCPGQMHYDTL